MRTLIDINLSILKEYDSWKNVNPNWTIGDYLYMKYDFNTAIAFSKLFFPNFIEKEGCVILEFRFKEAIFWNWHKLFNGDRKAIEYKCNYYEVKDYFEYKVENYISIENFNQAIDAFAQCIKKSWEINLKLLFPEKNMTVKVWDEHNTTKITLFSNS